MYSHPYVQHSLCWTQSEAIIYDTWQLPMPHRPQLRDVEHCRTEPKGALFAVMRMYVVRHDKASHQPEINSWTKKTVPILVKIVKFKPNESAVFQLSRWISSGGQESHQGNLRCPQAMAVFLSEASDGFVKCSDEHWCPRSIILLISLSQESNHWLCRRRRWWRTSKCWAP